VATVATPATYFNCQISLAFADTVITSIAVTFTASAGDGADESLEQIRGALDTALVFNQQRNGTGSSGTYTWTGSETLDVIGLQFRRPAGGNLTITQIVITGVGANPFVVGGIAGRGDAFYVGYSTGQEAQLYPSGDGLNIDGSPPGTIPVYSGSHRYIFTVTGTGSPIVFEFEDVDYDDNSNSILVVTICGSGMAMSAL
jgi:hypothetical protein